MVNAIKEYPFYSRDANLLLFLLFIEFYAQGFLLGYFFNSARAVGTKLSLFSDDCTPKLRVETQSRGPCLWWQHSS